jgi:Ca2+-binding EF-hand superfamily protein
MSEAGNAAMFAEIDADGNGTVEMDEFKAWWEANYSSYLAASSDSTGK